MLRVILNTRVPLTLNSCCRSIHNGVILNKQATLPERKGNAQRNDSQHKQADDKLKFDFFKQDVGYKTGDLALRSTDTGYLKTANERKSLDKKLGDHKELKDEKTIARKKNYIREKEENSRKAGGKSMSSGYSHATNKKPENSQVLKSRDDEYRFEKSDQWRAKTHDKYDKNAVKFNENSVLARKSFTNRDNKLRDHIKEKKIDESAVTSCDTDAIQDAWADTFGTLSSDNEHQQHHNDHFRRVVNPDVTKEDQSYPTGKEIDPWQPQTKEIDSSYFTSRDTDTVNSDWSDNFGSLSKDYERPLDHISAVGTEAYQEDEEQNKPHRRLEAYGRGRKHNQDYYNTHIERLGKEGKIYEAIEMLEITMLEKERVLPNRYTFNRLLYHLARVGYHEKAVEIHKKMKELGLDSHTAYMEVLTACANSPSKEDALRIAYVYRNQLVARPHMVNEITYACMIKAFGRLGDLEMAFSLVDEYDKRKTCSLNDHRVYQDLLSACLSDKEAGLKHAVEVWRIMRRRHIKFDAHHYGMLARCVRECGLGDPKFATTLIRDKYLSAGGDQPQQQLDNPFSSPGLNEETKQRLQNINSGHESKPSLAGEAYSSKDVITLQPVAVHTSDTTEIPLVDPSKPKTHKFWWQYDISDMIDKTPDITQATSAVAIVTDNASVQVENILNPKNLYRDVSALTNAKTPAERLAIFGGLSGFLSHMRKDRIVPNIKTFTLLMEDIPSDTESEELLLEYMKAAKVKPDVAFMNLLINRRNKRDDKEKALEILASMADYGLIPNTMTIGVLAKGMRSRHDLNTILQDSKTAGLVPSLHVYQTMISKLGTFNIKGYAYVLRSMLELKTYPNRDFINKLEYYFDKWDHMIVQKERGETADLPKVVKSPDFDKEYAQLKKYYSYWSKEMIVDSSKDVFKKFKNPTPEIIIDDYEDHEREKRIALEKETRPPRLLMGKYKNEPLRFSAKKAAEKKQKRNIRAETNKPSMYG